MSKKVTERENKAGEFLAWMSGENLQVYKEIIQKIRDGRKVTEQQKEFMAELRFWAEFIVPKLQRQEVTGPDGGIPVIKII